MRLSLMFLILFVFFISPCSSVPYFLEVYPDTWVDGDEDEYVTIGWEEEPGQVTISDGEGTIILTPLSSSRTCTIARNAEAYEKVWGQYPDFEILDGTPIVPQASLSGKFQLSNKKDELTLTANGVVYDSVSWPGTFPSRKGQIHYKSCKGLWDERILMAGGSRIEPETFQDVSGISFVSPDCSRAVLEDVIRQANTSVLLNVYEFTDPGVAGLLCDAQKRGVSVIVLLEGGPVGGIPADEFPVIYDLIRAGAEVLVMDGDGEDHTPYRYNHAKYLVVDDQRVLLTTENFKEHSFPKAGYAGNRGWGMLLESPDLAASFKRVFRDDSDGPGVIPASGRPGAFEEPVTDRYKPVFHPLPFSGAEVTTVFSPDTSHLIADSINQSSRRVWIEQAYITEYPGNGTNPFLSAAIDAARRGVDVRILLDGYYYNIEDDNDNDEMVTTLQTLAARENITLEARVLYPEKTGLLKVHTKGVIADDQVLISSMNWNENSACFNREAGVIVRNKEVASYFASVFLSDWSGKGGYSKVDDPTGRDSSGIMQMMALAAVIIFLILLYRRHHR